MSSGARTLPISDEKTKATENSVDGINKLIQKDADEKKSASQLAKDAKERTKKVFNAVNHVIAVVEPAAELFPPAKAVLGIFRALIKLEQDRKDNDEQVMVVYNLMNNLIFSLRYIDKRNSTQRELADKLEEELSAVGEMIREFGEFVDVYYTKYKLRAVKFVCSGSLKEKLTEFSTRFSEARTTFYLTLQLGTSKDVDSLLESVKVIISRLDKPMNKKEQEALLVLRAHTPEQAEQALGEMAKVLGEQVTTSTKSLVKETLESLMKANSDRFSLMLDGASKEVLDSVGRSTESILHKLNEGPHDFIKDNDLKQIWKENGFKMSVKCRPFVDAPCIFYHRYLSQDSPGAEERVKDRWILDIITPIAHQPAIADAIDDDCSGYISVYEADRFWNSCPKGWTGPQWLAFWALGWQSNNIDYTNEVEGLMDSIQRASNKATKQAGQDESLKEYISQYLEALNALRLLTQFTEHIDEDDGFDCAELQELCEKVAEQQDERISTNLQKIDWEVTEPSILTAIVNESGLRIEQWVMCILKHILSKHDDVISHHVRNQSPGEDEALDEDKWDDMSDTLILIAYMVHTRLKGLLRGWRSQRLDAGLQIQSFAGGLLGGWYDAYVDQSEGKMRKFMDQLAGDDDSDDEFDFDPDDDDDDDEEIHVDRAVDIDIEEAQSVGKSNQGKSADGVEGLSLRMTAMEAQLKRIESMLMHLTDEGNVIGPSSSSLRPPKGDRVTPKVAPVDHDSDDDHEPGTYSQGAGGRGAQTDDDEDGQGGRSDGGSDNYALGYDSD